MMFLRGFSIALVIVGVSSACENSCVDPGYELAFKVWACSNEDVLDLWKSERLEGCGAAATNLLAGGSYKSERVNTWHNVKRVKVVLYDAGGFEISHFTFNGEGKNKHNFFEKANLIESSFSDLDSGTDTNFFSKEGHDAVNHVKRNFFISKSYGGCGNDRGWLAITGCRDTPCNWDKGEGCPSFLTGTNKKAKFGASSTSACLFAIYLS